MDEPRHARAFSRRSLCRYRDAAASRRTVLVALVANAFVALVKLAGGLVTGSAALLAEAAHSGADTANQAFLLASIAMSAREPSAEHPFGEGRQRFLWTFMAAVGTFLAGAVFAVGHGVLQLVHGGQDPGGFGVAWATLVLAGIAEGISWVRALRQSRAEARREHVSLREHLRRTRDPSVKMVVFEDTAAVVGVAIAAAGIGLGQLTGQRFWDPVASIVIGLLLIAVALRMAHDSAEVLIGAAARPEERAAMERVLSSHPDVVAVLELLTSVLGPNAILVCARLDLRDDITAGQIEEVADELDQALRDAVPDVTEVFLDPTRSGSPRGTARAPIRA